MWSPIKINSLLFDQPFAHYNPQRDPFPTYSLTTPSAKFGQYTVLKPLIEKLNNFEIAHFKPEDLNSGFVSSPSFNQHNFRYVGNGYFYSPYSMSESSRVFNLFGQFLEGSLLDFQIGDFTFYLYSWRYSNSFSSYSSSRNGKCNWKTIG